MTTELSTTTPVDGDGTQDGPVLGPVAVSVGGTTFTTQPPTFARLTKILADTDERDWPTVVQAAF